MKKLKSAAIIAGIFVLGLLLNYYTWLNAGMLTGAGHGIYVPILYSCNVVWGISSPFLIAGANTPWRSVRLAAKGLVCLYYGWLLLHFGDLADLPREYRRIPADLYGVFWTWATCVGVTHVLIWLPGPLFGIYQKLRRPKVNESNEKESELKRSRS